MRIRLGIWLLPLIAATMLVLGLTGNFQAQQEGEEHHAHDKLLRRGLVDAMKHGVALYNKEPKDITGCIRVFEGTLYTIKPLLHHHKDLQKKIEDALTSSQAMPLTHQRAFALRAALDEVNDRLRGKVAVPDKDKEKKDVKVTDVPPKEEKKDDKKDDKKAEKVEAEKKDDKKVEAEKKDETEKKEKRKKKDVSVKDVPVKEKANGDKEKEAKDKKDEPIKEKEAKDKKDEPIKEKEAKDKKDEPVKEKEAKDKKDEPVKEKEAKEKDEPVKDKEAKEKKEEPQTNSGALNGKVTFKGEPLTIGFVTLIDKDGRKFSANIQKNGSYALTLGKALGKYGKTPGVPVGEYKVFLEKSTSLPEEGQKVIAIPEQYESAETTTLVVTINPGKNTFDINLKD